MIEMIGGPDRDRTDDLFHAISATSRNSLKLHDTNRAVMLLYAQNFAVAWTLNGPSRSINTTAFFAQMDCFRIARYSPRTPKSKIPLAVFGE